MTKLKDVLNKIRTKKRDDPGRYNFYISKKIHEDFKRLCGDISVSMAIEEIMRELIEESKKGIK